MTQGSCEHCLLGCIIVKYTRSNRLAELPWVMLESDRLWEPEVTTLVYMAISRVYHHPPGCRAIHLLLTGFLTLLFTIGGALYSLLLTSWLFNVTTSILYNSRVEFFVLICFLVVDGPGLKCWINLHKKN